MVLCLSVIVVGFLFYKKLICPIFLLLKKKRRTIRVIGHNLFEQGSGALLFLLPVLGNTANNLGR